ncbi:hypothetical protein AAF712_002803 [Marasmius tenuissimus]|uniref:Uncharacterized protein n=1 Tax=Marasmius tenuissimus TaxID=585030 RepID=A0ABR3A8J0_9AGAR
MDGADTAPSIHSEVNSTVTTRQVADNTQNVGGHVSPSGDADSRVHNGRPAPQLAPRRQIPAPRMRSFTPFTSLDPRVFKSAAPHPSLITAEGLWKSVGSSLSSAAPRYIHSHRPVSGLPMEGQDGDTASIG